MLLPFVVGAIVFATAGVIFLDSEIEWQPPNAGLAALPRHLMGVLNLLIALDVICRCLLLLLLLLLFPPSSLASSTAEE